MKLNEEQMDMVVNFGAFEYDAEKIANILDFDRAEVEAEMANKDSEFNQLYKKGKDRADYAIDAKLFDLARLGDLKALAKYEQRKRKRLQ